jgi:LDH2 family malate/lactate/ureidoglycolate dehydrogenase
MKIAVEKLRTFMVDAAVALPLDRQSAEIMVDNLITANLWGVNSHGVGRYPNYMRRLRKDLVNRNPDIKITNKFPAVFSIDGDNGLGAVVTVKAVETAIKAADTYGIALAGIKNSNHFGAAGYFCNIAAEKGYVSMICTVGPANMPPYGGMAPYFSTNPLAVGLPCIKRPHVILDIATAMAAKGKIREAARKGEPIPEGWAIDKDGNPTTDAKAALDGLVVPMSGHKGSGLALIIEMLAGVSTGSGFGLDVVMQYGDDPTPANVGHSLIVYKPEALLPKDEYNKRVQRICDDIHAIKPAKGFTGVMLPGEKEFENEIKIKESGIEIDAELRAQLAEIEELSGIKLVE